ARPTQLSLTPIVSFTFGRIYLGTVHRRRFYITIPNSPSIHSCFRLKNSLSSSMLFSLKTIIDFRYEVLFRGCNPEQVKNTHHAFETQVQWTWLLLRYSNSSLLFQK